MLKKTRTSPQSHDHEAIEFGLEQDDDRKLVETFGQETS
jgi:hypothetical protein